MFQLPTGDVSYFHCKRSTQPWLFFESRFLPSPTSCSL
jgi:hypothetical protein